MCDQGCSALAFLQSSFDIIECLLNWGQCQFEQLKDAEFAAEYLNAVSEDDDPKTPEGRQSVAPRLKQLTAMKRAKREPIGPRLCAGYERWKS